MGVATVLQPSGPAGSQCRTAPFNATPFTDWPSCNRTLAIPDSCPYNASTLTAMLDWAASQGVTKASVWRSDIDTQCFAGTAPFYYDVLAKWIAGGTSTTPAAARPPPHPPPPPQLPPLEHAGSADPGGGKGFADPPAAGGECSNSCAPGKPSCPLTVPSDRCGYLYGNMVGSLEDLIGNGTAAAPELSKGANGRDLPSAALAVLMSGCAQPGGCCAPAMAACVQPPSPPVCAAATALLKRFGTTPGTSFGGQAYPLLWHAFGTTCFRRGTEGYDLVLGAINRSLPMTKAEATPQEVSYTNMYLMSTVNSILFGEIIAKELPDQSARAQQATGAVGETVILLHPPPTFIRRVNRD